MKIINVEASVFQSMLERFEAFTRKVDALCRQQKQKELGKWFDNQDVCQILNISKRTLQTYRENGTLPFTRIGHKMYYKPEDIEHVMQRNGVREKKKEENNGQ